MKQYILILLTLIVVEGCKEQRSSAPEQTTNATPQALSPNSKYEDRGSWGSSYGGRGNLVLNLYKEAIDNDPNLKKLDKSYLQVQKTIRDSVRAYNRYQTLIDNYWSDVNSQLSNMNDTTRRNSVKDKYEIMQNDWQSKITNHTKTIETLDSIDRLLEDEMTLLRIAISQPMMFNYHKNELPAISSYKTAMKAVDEQLIKTRTFLEDTDISAYELER